MKHETIEAMSSITGQRSKWYKAAQSAKKSRFDLAEATGEGKERKQLEQLLLWHGSVFSQDGK